MSINRIAKVISKCKRINRNITTAITVVVVLLLAVACGKDKPDTIAAIEDRSALPKLHASDITTVISDSGVTRYRISAPQWNVYDKANQPYWEFPDGIHFEKFDLNLMVDANIHANYARFNENEQLWELKGNVRSTNLQGELFETEQMFWNQRDERFYSDSLIKITQKSHIITGIGFESNQSMTRYVIRQPQGIFPIDENEDENNPPSE
jgi:LPS export ABC transporter protein LptC